MAQNSFYFVPLRAAVWLPDSLRDVAAVIRIYCYDAHVRKNRLSVNWLYCHNKI